MSKIILMVIICMVPVDDTLEEVWRIEQEVTLEHCLTMNQVISGAGPAAAFVVTCG